MQTLNGSYAPLDALGWGTAAAVFVLIVAFLKLKIFEQTDAVFPKTLDLGQLLLFGFLWVLALVFEKKRIGWQLSRTLVQSLHDRRYGYDHVG